jgi:putative SOS response-associated peptidase YedK
MCNRYRIRDEATEMARRFKAHLTSSFDSPTEILPGYIAPGLLRNLDGERELVPMQFGLAKIGADESIDKKFPNNNARIEKFDKWPWKLPFKSHRCILPVSEFREPCYWGPTAGTEVYFKPLDGEYLGVAGIYNIWKTIGDQPFYTMSFLMRPASEYVMENGHQRQPFFLEPDGYDAWMEPGERDPKDSLAILRKYAYERPFEYETAREMAASWKSRQKARLTDRDEQLEDIGKTGRLGF